MTHWSDGALNLLRHRPSDWRKREGNWCLRVIISTWLKRELKNRAAWRMFSVHSRDAFRHGLRAMAIHLQVDEGEGPVDCANNLLQLAQSSSVVPRGLPADLPRHVAFYEKAAADVTRVLSKYAEDAAEVAWFEGDYLWTLRDWSIFTSIRN